MILDPTDEIRAIRNRLAEKCNFDLDRIVEETRRHQLESGRTYLTLAAQAPAASITTNAIRPSGEVECAEVDEVSQPPRDR